MSLNEDTKNPSLVLCDSNFSLVLIGRGYSSTGTIIFGNIGTGGLILSFVRRKLTFTGTIFTRGERFNFWTLALGGVTDFGCGEGDAVWVPRDTPSSSGGVICLKIGSGLVSLANFGRNTFANGSICWLSCRSRSCFGGMWIGLTLSNNYGI